MSADRIQNGTLTLGCADNGNGRMVIQNAQGQQIGYWDNTGLHVDEGVVSGSAIQGGTLTLGGANNTGGRLIMKNATGTQIGYWDNTGLHVDLGTISGSAISGGQIDATQVAVINLSASNITSGEMSADRITSGTMSAARIQGGTLTLGGNGNGNGQLVVRDANGNSIGTWSNAGLWAKGSIEAGAWKFDSNGAKYTKNSIYAMGLGDYANSPAICGGVYFSIDQTTGTGSVRLVSKNYSSTIINYVEMTSYYDSASGTYRGRLMETGYSGNASVDFGGPNNPWYHNYMVNIYGYNGLHLYPKKGEPGVNLTESSGYLILAPDSGYQNMLGQNNSTQMWHFCYFGNVYYSSLVQNSSRDIKHDIQDMEPVGEKLDELRPVTFVYDEDKDEKKRFGLIYEETKEVMPEICTDDESNKAINYVELIPMLLKEIQELRARVKALEERG
jgi:sporulation protein YlmC with PRC-barrel domain